MYDMYQSSTCSYSIQSCILISSSHQSSRRKRCKCVFGQLHRVVVDVYWHLKVENGHAAEWIGDGDDLASASQPFGSSFASEQ
jgi:hypothetical protein